MRVEDSALTPDVRAAQVRKGTRLPSETTKLSVSRSARSAVTKFVPSYPAFQVTPPYLTTTKWLFHLVSGFIPSSVYFSCSVVYFTSFPPHVGASGHTVFLLAVTVVLVLECSAGGEGN